MMAWTTVPLLSRSLVACPVPGPTSTISAGRQQGEEGVEQPGGIRGPDLVIDRYRLVEREPRIVQSTGAVHVNDSAPPSTSAGGRREA